jgi:hypothetical protein
MDLATLIRGDKFDSVNVVRLARKPTEREGLMRSTVVAWTIALALSGCASSVAGSVGRTSVETTRVATTTGTTSVTMTSTVTPGLVNLEFPIEHVWRVLPVAYDSIGIPIGKIDTLSHVVGNDGYKLRRKLGGVPLTRYLDCGQAQGFKSAETYEINLSVLTQLKSAGTSRTTAATVVQASAKPVNFAGEFSACSSTGELEKRVADVLSRVVRQ